MTCEKRTPSPSPKCPPDICAAHLRINCKRSSFVTFVLPAWLRASSLVVSSPPRFPPPRFALAVRPADIPGKQSKGKELPLAVKHILGTFDTALSALHDNLLLMADHCHRNLQNAMRGLLARDDDLCNRTIADDEEVDLFEKQIDRDGIDLLRRFQPVASDLRIVIATMKLSGNLERIADQAVSIARRARRLNSRPALPEVTLLEPMFREAAGMTKDALRAFADGDAELARLVMPRDKTVDRLNSEMTSRFCKLMAESPDRISDYLELILIARHLERVGDHAQNIAEDVIYLVAAEDVRHLHPAPEPA